MPIVVPNGTYTTTRPQGGIVIANPTRNTLPKPGRNGTGSQFTRTLDLPTGDVPTKHGNAFGLNSYAERTPVSTPTGDFGQRANVAIATGSVAGGSYIGHDFDHPNAHFFDIARQVKRAPTQVGSASGNYAAPATVWKGQPGDNPPTTVMPHQRNGIGANQGPNLDRQRVYRSSAGGANQSLPSNTPFHQKPVRRVVTPASAGTIPQSPDTTAHHEGKVSFRSSVNLWYDPNASFVQGATNTQTGRTGVGRWNITKRGAAG